MHANSGVADFMPALVLGAIDANLHSTAEYKRGLVDRTSLGEGCARKRTSGSGLQLSIPDNARLNFRK